MARLVPIFILLLGAAGCQLHQRALESPTEAPPGSGLPYSISDMHLRITRPMSYLYTPLRTSFNDLSGPAAREIADLRRLGATGQVRPTGPVVFIYFDPSEDPDAYFDMEIGMPALPGNPPPGYVVRELPAFRCATVIYRGPLKLIPNAYDRLIRAMIEADLIPSEETREVYLAWEGPDSPNNVIQIEVGVR